ncbi:MAG: S8 family peptidase [Nanoarchaeota archaeon]|nr:S8 family peptidase [Nanoarchaeota archaeon]
MKNIDLLNQMHVLFSSGLPFPYDYESAIEDVRQLQGLQYQLQATHSDEHVSFLSKSLISRIRSERRRIARMEFSPWSKGFSSKLDDELYFPGMKQDILLELDKIIDYHESKQTYSSKSEPINPDPSLEELFLEHTHSYFNDNPGQILIPIAQANTSDIVAFRQEAAKELSDMFQSRAQAFETIDYMTLDVDWREESEIMGRIQRERFDWLGSHDELVESKPVYLPEHTLTDNNIMALWNLHNIGAFSAQEITLGEGTVVGIIDTGVDYKHPELRRKFPNRDRGWNYVDNNNEIMDKAMHGTHVAGTVAGTRVGVAPGTSLRAFVVLNSRGVGSLANVMHALENCILRQVDVVNMSLGGPSYVGAFERLCMEAYNRNVMIAAAAGNEGLQDGYSFPGAYHGVLGVAAVDRFNNWINFSNVNDRNDLSAPGDTIYSCIPGGYTEMSGTSMASPHVAGSLALVKSGAPHLNAQEIYSLITRPDCVKQIGDDRKKFGAGLVRPDYCLQNTKIKEPLMVSQFHNV